MNYNKINLGKEFDNHKVFNELKVYSDFYNSLSFAIFNRISVGTKAIFNIDSYTISSIKGTVDSIAEILSKGRINDAYALIRKYFDSTFINVYTNLYLQDNLNLNQNNIIVDKIENWRNGTTTIPEFRVISQYIKESNKLKPITDILKKDDRYKKIRNSCNDNTHYNFYYNFLLNDNQIYNNQKIKHLDSISFSMESLFIQHFAYLFYLNDNYLMDSEYTDCMDLGITLEEDSLYWVSPFIQKVFNEIITTKRPDISKAMKNNTQMKLG